MNYHILEKIEQKMYIHLNSQQQKALHDVLVECLNEEEEKNNGKFLVCESLEKNCM